MYERWLRERTKEIMVAERSPSRANTMQAKCRHIASGLRAAGLVQRVLTSRNFGKGPLQLRQRQVDSIVFDLFSKALDGLQKDVDFS